MSQIPRLKRQTDRRPITLSIDEEIKKLYETGKQNGWDVSEIARRLLTDGFTKLAQELKRPAS